MLGDVLRHHVLKILDSEYQLDADYVQSKGWYVVPVESGYHFDDSDMQRLASKLDESHYDELNAVLIESLKNVPNCFVFSTGIKGLREFNNEFGHFNFAICPDDLSFLIICCATDDYFVIAGSKSFVESILGTDIQTGRENFDLFAEDEPDILKQIGMRCKEISAS